MRYDAVCPRNLTEMPCSHSKIKAATTTIFFLAVFQLAEFFPAAFRLKLKIFGLAAKLGGLGV